MKKLIAVALVVIAIIIPTTITAFAETTQGNGMYGALAETELNYHKYSEYSVTVPNSIVCDSSNPITVDGYNIEDGYSIAGFVTNTDENGNIELSLSSGEKAYASLQFDYTDFTPGMEGRGYGLFHQFTGFDNVQEQSVYFSASIPSAPEQAGQYTGVICFRFDCVPTNYFN